MSRAAAQAELDDLAMARLLADAADQISLEVYRSGELLVARKPDTSELTQADLAVEDHLRQLVRAHRPEQGMLGEERGAQGSKHWRWIVDPIDATGNYIRGIDWWATLLALEVDGRVEVAMVSAPAMGRRWWAINGAGAWTHWTQSPGALPCRDRGALRRAPGLRRPARRPVVPGTGRGVLAHPRHRRLPDVVPARRRRRRRRARPGRRPRVGSGRPDPAGHRGRRSGHRPAGQPWAEGKVVVASNGLLHPRVLGTIRANPTPRPPAQDRGG